MYRICDLINGFDGREMRRNITEKRAQVGNILAFPDVAGHWKVIRTHGYSIFED